MHLRQLLVIPANRPLRVIVHALFSTDERRQTSVDGPSMVCRQLFDHNLPKAWSPGQIEIHESREREISDEIADRPGIKEVWTAIESKRVDFTAVEGVRPRQLRRADALVRSAQRQPPLRSYRAGKVLEPALLRSGSHAPRDRQSSRQRGAVDPGHAGRDPCPREGTPRNVSRTRDPHLDAATAGTPATVNRAIESCRRRRSRAAASS
jgi:hypothetical protein